MKLSEYLLNLDVADLRAIAGRYACDCNRHSKLDLVQTIHYEMLDSGNYERLFATLDREIFYVMTYLLFQPKAWFSLEELMGKGTLIQKLLDLKGSPKTWIARLVHSGWLFPVSTKFHIQYEIPEDFRPFLQQQFIRAWQRAFDLPDAEPARLTVRDEERSLLHDLKTWLHFVAEKRPPLTKEGVLHKRFQHQLMKKMRVAEQLVEGRPWRVGYGRRFPFYPHRFAFIYDFSYDRGWIREEPGGLDITEAGHAKLTDPSLLFRVQQKDCFHYWLKTYGKPLPTLPFLVHWMNAVLLQQWISTDKLYNAISPWISSYYYDDVPTIFRERIIQMLLHLGLIQIGVHAQSERHYVRKKAGNFFGE